MLGLRRTTSQIIQNNPNHQSILQQTSLSHINHVNQYQNNNPTTHLEDSIQKQQFQSQKHSSQYYTQQPIHNHVNNNSIQINHSNLINNSTKINHSVNINQSMNIKKSINVNTSKLNNSQQKYQPQEIYNDYQNRSKIPHSLLTTLRKRAQQSHNYKEKIITSKEISNLGLAILSKFKKQEISCGICLGVMKQKSDIVYLCNCKHTFCKNCIRDYVTYKIKMYEQVVCPQDGCAVIMSQQTQFYNNLAEQIKKQYIKVHNFYMTSNDPSLKLCPKQNCEGIIKIIENTPRICQKCKKQFCPKCYLDIHEGNCDDKQIDFLQNNLHFRQCQNCKMVVERTQGCNHMTCKCKYQFCYVCGAKWRGYDHVCNQNQAQQGRLFQQNGCCECCNCCEGICGDLCCTIISIPIRVILSLLSLIVLALIFFQKMLVLGGVLLGTIIFGGLGYPVQLIMKLCEDDNCGLIILCVILLPLTILYGVLTAFRQIFVDIVCEQCDDYCDKVMGLCGSIWR